MAFTITFPIDIGTFVVVDSDDNATSLLGRVGNIVCYQCVDKKDDEFIVMVSGYKDPWCGEYLLSQIRVATDKEVAEYKILMGIL